MKVVHPACASLDKDDVLWFWHGALQGATVCGLHQDIKWGFCFSRVFVSHASTVPNLAGPSKYGSDLFLIGGIFSVSSSLLRSLPTWVSIFGDEGPHYL